MPPPEPELDHITNLLGMCLGRIEEHAFRLQRDADEVEDLAVGYSIEDEASLLQELVGSLLDQAAPEEADLNATIERAVQSCLSEVGIPVVVRQRLARGLPRVACTPGQLAFAVQRALVLGLGRLEPGGEVVLTSRCENGSLLFELESRGRQDDRHLAERAETLAEFVAGFEGHCRVQADGDHTLLLVLELPAAFVPDEH
jgi:hypothetical protein